jgi:hypothetical protein
VSVVVLVVVSETVVEKPNHRFRDVDEDFVVAEIST